MIFFISPKIIIFSATMPPPQQFRQFVMTSYFGMMQRRSLVPIHGVNVGAAVD
jgi:hypothetical protein